MYWFCDVLLSLLFNCYWIAPCYSLEDPIAPCYSGWAALALPTTYVHAFGLISNSIWCVAAARTDHTERSVVMAAFYMIRFAPVLLPRS